MSHTTQVTASEGSNTYYILCNDTIGNLMADYYELSFTYTPPTQTVSNRSTTDSEGIAVVDLNDIPSGADQMTIQTGSQLQTRSITFSSGVTSMRINARVLANEAPVPGKTLKFELS